MTGRVPSCNPSNWTPLARSKPTISPCNESASSCCKASPAMAPRPRFLPAAGAVVILALAAAPVLAESVPRPMHDTKHKETSCCSSCSCSRGPSVWWLLVAAAIVIGAAVWPRQSADRSAPGAASPEAANSATAPAGADDLQFLKGRWIRPDGNYLLEIRQVERAANWMPATSIPIRSAWSAPGRQRRRGGESVHRTQRRELSRLSIQPHLPARATAVGGHVFSGGAAANLRSRFRARSVARLQNCHRSAKH